MRKLLLCMLLGACAAVQPGLVPSSWQVVALEGRPLQGDARVTMEFAAGRVSGVSGCNRYTGPFTLGDEGAIEFGILATTRMACAGEAATIEAAFLRQIDRITAYRLERGALVLLARGDAVMRAERQ